jgi:hypothetical protein
MLPLIGQHTADKVLHYSIASLYTIWQQQQQHATVARWAQQYLVCV